MADHITPELIEAGAEALANHFYPPNGWSIAREEGKAVYRSSARALLTAVAPALEQRIDRARADELRKQAAKFRAQADNQGHPPTGSWSDGSKATRLENARELEACARSLSVPTQEN